MVSTLSESLSTPDNPRMAEDVERIADRVPGARAHSPLQMPRSAWWAILKRVYVMNGVHNLALLAAGVAFFAFLAFVPLIAVIVLLYGLIADPATVTSSLDLLTDVAPAEVLSILREQLLQIVSTSSTQQGLGLVLALLFSTYGAMRAATAMMRALNIIYEEHETRGFFRTTLVAIMITLGMAGIAVVGLVSISLFSYVRNFLAPYIGASSLMLIQTMTWVVAAVLVSVTFAIFFSRGWIVARPSMVTVSSPFRPRLSQLVPSSKTNGITPMPTRLER